MRLKKLDIFGFKSFADRTQVVFDHGVTCIVGPNGCGKSNISDSIRWVLGERSAKLLRGSKMEDVIFNGTEFRKPLAMAEVSLTIDNADRGLPIDYQEVTITRRLYRSGESEYLINKTVCRLKDIQDLILDTGIGSNSYSMIEQGRIDYILNADPEARRFLIEEAAGISKYKVKKEEAIRKLERTEENRLRLGDIINEVQKNIQYAERQAKRAARYREEFEKLKNLETQKAVLEIQELSAQRQSLEKETSELNQGLAEIETLISSVRKSQDELNFALSEIHERYSAAESQRYGLQSRIEQNQQQVKFNQEKLLEAANRVGQIAQENTQLSQRIEKAQIEIALKNQENEGLSAQRQTAQEDVQKSEQAIKSLESEIETLKRKLQEIKNEAFQAATRASQVRNDYHRFAAFLETSNQQKKKHEAGAVRFREDAAQWQARKENYEKEIAAFDEKLQALNSDKQALEDLIIHLRSEYASCQEQAEALRRNIHEKETRLNLLLEIDHAARSSEESLLEGLELEKSLIKNLREIFTVKPGFEWALEAALETFSRSVIAEDLSVANVLLNRIREKKVSPMGILVRNLERSMAQRHGRPAHSRIVCALSDVVEILPDYQSLFADFLSDVFIAETSPEVPLLEDFFAIAGNCKLIFQEGVVLGPQHKVFFRNTHTSSEDNLFRRGAEMTALQSELAALRQEQETQSNLSSDLQTRLAQKEADLNSVESAHLDATIQKESFESMARGMQDRLDSIKKEMDLHLYESQELDAQQAEAMSQKSNLEKELQQLEAQELSVREMQDQLSRELDDVSRKRDSLLQNHADNKARFSHLNERAHLIQEALTLMSDHLGRDRKRIEDLAIESAALAERETRLKEQTETLNAEHVQLQEFRREADIALELVKQEKERVEAQAQELQNALLEHQKKQHELQQKLHQQEMKLMDLGYQERNVAERLEQTYRIKISEINPETIVPAETQREELENTIRQLKEKVEGLGTVNLLAIEEYEELKQRYDFLLAQQKDLDDAREQLMETIRKINRTTKGLFEETFANVQKTFQEYYQTLFRGGLAKLVLIDETNPLESGIDIVVRPPGKKLQNISLLSGGEKALTAMALLFALFKIKPSPFCVLDEVDAPLDEANIDRFLGVLETFLESSQFIIVTHNRKTIAMGDSLYGVTMEQAGVSKLVSVKVSNESIPGTEQKQTQTDAEQIPV